MINLKADQKSSLRILIAGAGSIGTCLGILLHHAGYTITLLRRKASSKRLQIKLIGIEEISSTMSIESPLSLRSASRTNNKKFHWDIIIISCQRQQTTNLMNDLLTFTDFNKPIIWITMQNGLKATEIVQTMLADFDKNMQTYIQAIVWWSATAIDESTILYHNKAPTILGTPHDIRNVNQEFTSNHQKNLALISEIFEQVIDVQTTENIEEEAKKKLLLNVVSPVLALIKLPYPHGINNEIVRKTIHLLFDDVLGIAMNLEWNVDDTRLHQFHQILCGQIQASSQYDVTHFPQHKVSTQISMEKYGGKGSNARELLGFFVEQGSQTCTYILNLVETKQQNYEKLSFNELKQHLKELLRLIQFSCNQT